jgi:Tol biopolymer transport system component
MMNYPGVKQIATLGTILTSLLLPIAKATPEKHSSFQVTRFNASARPNRKPSTGGTHKSANQTLAGAGSIAFASDRDGNFEVYTMDTDGGAQRRLTENPAEDFSPTWSPDGNRLAFVSSRDGNSEIYLMNADGTGQTRLTNNSAADLDPKWSPDGAQILFFSNRDGNDEIYSMNPDGSNQLNLTNHPADDASFSFSPDGSKIAFTSARDDSQFDIYTMTVIGAVVTRLTTAPGDDTDPSWSTHQIVFQSNRDDSDELYSINPNGQNELRLTTNANLDIDPTQPTNGSSVGFSSNRDGNLEIYLMNADGTSPVRLTTNEAADIQPELQPQASVFSTGGATLVEFTSAGYLAGENTAIAILTVTRTGNTSGITTVEFATVNGTATNRSDYSDHFGTLTFNPGETSKSFTILITDDVFIENDETVTATLSNVTGAALGSLNTATLTITDNDAVLASANPIDNARFFVTQHYADFLNRAPEPAGLAGWIEVINQCGNNLTCLHQRRIDVSSGFFRSAEFQSRGYFVYRFYPVSFGRPPTYAEFIPDMSGVSGFVTDEQLEAAKLAFINDFTARPAFVNKYGGLNNTAYVDTLLSTAGVNLPNRQALIDALNAGTKTRAQVLRDIIESGEVYLRYYNQAFVVMSYFGYLRRDPDILYLNWIDLLNSTGNFDIMINGFVNSLEYRSRFGP